MTGLKIARRSCVAFALLLLTGLFSTGCMYKYSHNRWYDFADIFELGAGVTTENPVSGPLPPAIGLHVQVTEFLNFGGVYFNGISAEIDGRGYFAGHEERLRVGCLPLQKIRITQDYEYGDKNYFKTRDTLWDRRLQSSPMRFMNKPAKELHYKSVDERWSKRGSPLFYRGWQYWGNTGVEVALCEPFLTHWGFDLRVLIDPSEISDFLLGWFGIDFKSDDMNDKEFDEYCEPCRKYHQALAEEAARKTAASMSPAVEVKKDEKK